MEGHIASFKNIRWFMQKPQYGNVESFFSEKLGKKQYLLFYETVGKQQYPQSLFYEKVGSQQQYQPKTHFNQVSQYEFIITLLHYYFSMNHHGFIEENHLL